MSDYYRNYDCFSYYFHFNINLIKNLINKNPVAIASINTSFLKLTSHLIKSNII